MIINGFDYTEKEIQEALMNRGYKLIPYTQKIYNTIVQETGHERVTFESGFYALKNGKIPNMYDDSYTVAQMEFKIEKPSLY